MLSGKNIARAYELEFFTLQTPIAPGRIRTCDLGFRKALLCPLSYGGRLAPSAVVARRLMPYTARAAVKGRLHERIISTRAKHS